MSSVLIVICFSLLIVVSLAGNCLVCRTLFRQKRFCANSTNVLIGMLSISDLMMTTFNIPFTVVDIILNDWIFGDFFCILVSFVQANSVYVSSFTMAVIAIDRCKAIYKFRPKPANTSANNNNNQANENSTDTPTITQQPNSNDHSSINHNNTCNHMAVNNSNESTMKQANSATPANTNNQHASNTSACCLLDCFPTICSNSSAASTTTSNNQAGGGACCCCCCFDTIKCPWNKTNHQQHQATPTGGGVKLELRTKMILIISGIWIMAALHSIPHTIFNHVTVIETRQDPGLSSASTYSSTPPLSQLPPLASPSPPTPSSSSSSDSSFSPSAFSSFENPNLIGQLIMLNKTYATPMKSASANQMHHIHHPSQSSSSNTVSYGQTSKRRCVPIIPPWFGVNFSLWLTLYTTTTQYIIPLSIAAIIYTRIAFTINSQGKVGQMTETRAERINKHKRRRLLMLALIVAIFALCWLPFNVYYLLLDFGITKSYNHTAFLICLWLATSSVCYNPFVYCWLNKSFRKEAKMVWNRIVQLFSCCCCCCRGGGRGNNHHTSNTGDKTDTSITTTTMNNNNHASSMKNSTNNKLNCSIIKNNQSINNNNKLHLPT